MLQKSTDEKQKIIAYAASAFAVSSLITGAEILSFPSPLSVSVSAVSNPHFSVFMLLGTVISTFIYGNFAERFYYLLSLAICCILRVIIFGTKKESTRNLSAIAFVSFFSSVVVLPFAAPKGYGILTHFFASIICAFAAFCAKSAYISVREKKYLSLTSLDGFFIATTFTFVISLLSIINASAVNIGIIATMISSLFVGKSLNKSAGCVCAALGILGVSLHSPQAGRLCVLLPVFVLISLIFSDKGKKYCAAIFVLLNLMFCLLTNLSADSLVYLLNVITAAIVFGIYKTERFSDVFRSEPLKNMQRELLLEKRMHFVASALKELRKDTVFISQILQKRDKLPSTPNHLAETFCKKCDNRRNCWEIHENEAYEAFGFFRPNRTVSPSTLPTYFDDCPSRLEIAKEYGFFEQEKALEKANDNMRKEIQTAIFSLLEAQEETFMQSTEYICKLHNADYDLSTLAKASLEKCGIKDVHASVFVNENQGLSVEVYIGGIETPSDEDICDAISEALNLDFSICGILRTSDGTKINLMQAGEPDFDFAFAQSPAENDICGDYCLVFSDGFGNQYCALSDGMGHGKDAALNARFCLSLLKKLTCSGIPPYAATGLINSAMMIKDNGDSFATLDITKIDSSNGNTELLKSGASATLIRTDNRVICIKAASFPLGIVGVAEPYKKTLTLKSGDEFVMLSDGIEEEYYQYIKSLMLHKQDLSAKELSDEICKTVSESYKNGKKDDITVCVGIIK